MKIVWFWFDHLVMDPSVNPDLKLSDTRIDCMVPTNLGPLHMGSQVPLTLSNPNMEAKPQLLSLKKPFKYQ